MIWMITCYNGTIWHAGSQMTLTEALAKFVEQTKLSECDIKNVANLS